MATNKKRHQKIDFSLLIGVQASIEQHILLWEKLSTQLVGLIGSAGFHALYARSIHRARVQYVWLQEDANLDFIELKACLDAQELSVAHDASIHLFTIFTDTLTVLIGESLTNTILQSAVSHNIMNAADKDTE